MVKPCISEKMTWVLLAITTSHKDFMFTLTTMCIEQKRMFTAVADPGFDLRGVVDFVNRGGGGGKNH